MRKVSHLQEQFALFHEFGTGDGQGIDGAGKRGVHIAFGDDGLCGCVICLGIFKCGAGVFEVCGRYREP